MLSMSSAREHGGDWALLGFYYQMLAVLGIGTLNCEELPASDADTKSLLTTVTSDKDIILISEEGDQDVALLAGEHRILFQCKHSSNPVSRTVDMSEFRSVLEGFAYNLLSVEKTSNSVISGYILLTNRLPHSVIHEVKEIVQQCRDALCWQSNQINNVVQDTKAFEDLRVVFSKQNHSPEWSIKELVMDWLLKRDKKGKVKEVPDNKLLQAALRVLPNFYFLTEVNQSLYQEAFVRFAQRYGATDKEAENAVDSMLGKMLQSSGRTKQIRLRTYLKILD